MKSGRFSAAVFAAIWLAAGLPAAGQTDECSWLRQHITELGRIEDPGPQRTARAMRRQQELIDRTADYARGLGCDRRQFEIFGSPPLPQCAQINARLEQMGANLETLRQSQSRTSYSDRTQRDELVERFNATCRGEDRAAEPFRRSIPADAAVADRDVDAPPEPGYRRLPLDPDDIRRDPNAPLEEPSMTSAPSRDAPANEAAGATLGGSKAVCVRTCDGSFFPISYSATAEAVPKLEALCHANCPNAETRLYTYEIAGEIDAALDKEGHPYSDLPNARRFEKVIERTCTCRAPGRSWVETLADAERLYVDGTHDTVVTQAMSDASALRVTAARRPAPISKVSRVTQGRPVASASLDARVPSDTDAPDARDAAENGVPPRRRTTVAEDDASQQEPAPEPRQIDGRRSRLSVEGRKRRFRVAPPDF